MSKAVKIQTIHNAVNFLVLKAILTLDGSWGVHFDPRWGGPDAIIFNSLTDWRKSSIVGVKFYSGTARYQKTFALSTFNPFTPKSSLTESGLLGPVTILKSE